MKVLKLLWRILVVLFREINSLWKKYQAYRALKAQQQEANDNSALDPSPPDSVSPSSAESIEATVESEDEGSPKINWVPPGTATQVQGILIADGFIYLGASQSEHAQTVPALIDPALEIKIPTAAKRQAILGMDWGEEGRLSYAILSPELRSIFLGWLATGRKDREIPRSALLLFLFGIERRSLELLAGDRTVDELLALLLELERLDVHYAHYSTITPHIKQLIECCQVQLALSCQPETLLALLPVGQKLSMALKVALGQCIERNKPIPMTLLWAWYQSSSVAVDLKTPAKRCESAFNFLIHTRGEQAGFSIEAGDNPAMLSVTYETFGPKDSETPETIAIIDTIDITELEAQLTTLEPLIERCTNDLDAYSRLLGRSPEAEGTPTAVALLPQELVFISGNDNVKAIQDWCHQTLESDNFVTCPAEELLNLWPTATAGKIRKKEAESLGQLLAKFGFGYVPDVRYGQATFNTKHPIVLFRLEQLGIVSPSAEYPIALIALELMPFFESLGAETANISLIKSAFELAPSEQLRLMAVAQWRIERPLTWKQACSRIKKLAKEDQAKLAIALKEPLEDRQKLDDAHYIDLQALIPLPERTICEPESPTAESPTTESPTTEAVADTQALENSELEETYELSTVSDESEASESSESESSEVIADEPPAPVFSLDTTLIAQRNQESQVAAGLLTDIFEEDEPTGLTQSPPSLPLNQDSDISSNASSPALALDEFHWHLLKKIGQKESWPRTELEAIAQDQGLLLDGALENINDVAFDHCDEALTEGDDPIEVNDWVYEELQAA